MRPIGGLFFGILGDKTGRKNALQISMILMFIATFTIGCLPSVSKIGIWAPILLTLLRLFQGISVGGQLVGSILFIVESARPEKRGFYGALTMMTAVMGGIAASWVVSLLHTIFTDEQMKDWAWRIPFLSSFIVAILGFISQRHMDGSHEFLTASQQGQIMKNPIKDAIKIHWKIIMLICLAVIVWSCGGYMIYTFLPIYLQSQWNVEHALLVNSFIMCYLMGSLVCSGYLADKYNYHIIMIIGALIVTLWAFPGFYIMNEMYVIKKRNDVYWPLIIGELITSTGLGLFGGPMQFFMVYAIEDVTLRYSSIGIAYNLCQAMLGGTAPLIGTALSLLSFEYVGIYVAISSAVSVLALCIMRKYGKAKHNFDFAAKNYRL